jgi:hypothetical protein
VWPLRWQPVRVTGLVASHTSIGGRRCVVRRFAGCVCAVVAGRAIGTRRVAGVINLDRQLVWITRGVATHAGVSRR